MQATSSWGSLWMPLSLASTAAVLREHDHPVQLIDCQAEVMNTRQLLDAVEAFNSSFVIINTGFPSIIGDMRTAASIKEHFQSIKIVAIGMFPTLLKKKMLEQYQSIDYAIVGEPEWAVNNLVDTIENNMLLSSVQGLVFRDLSDIIENPPQCFDDNSIEDLPFPARDLLDNNAYRHVSDNEKFTHINIARGCPHSCSYCAARYYYGHKFRKRPVGSIIEELNECIVKYGIRKFVFWSESFTLEREFGIHICNKIIEHNLKIVWYTRSRVDNLDLELLRKMKRAGCKGISIGIESPNNDILNACKKHITVEQINNAIRVANQVGVHVTGHFVFGLPGDSYRSALEAIRFARESKLDFAQFYCAVPYPQTNLWKTAIKNDWIESFDYSRYHLADSVMRNEFLSCSEIIELRKRAFSHFYNRPRTLISAVSLAVKNKSVIPHLDFLKWSKV
ncbi:radical SAM protein [Candidatus Dojkabacteria bacterium]|nr:radical SAM protein [Candidatus Dojkabacteria bacterium]